MSQGVKPTSQSRSAETRDKLITALERLLKHKDFSQISVSEIAAEAGVAVGTVYRRFENKEAFLPVLVERLRQRGLAMAENHDMPLIQSGDGLHATLKRVARQAWGQISAEEHLFRTLYLYVRLQPDLVAEGWQDIEAMALQQIRDLLEVHRAEIARPDLEEAARMTAYFFGTIFTERALFGHVAAQWIAQIEGEMLADRMADFAYGYLTMSQNP